MKLIERIKEDLTKISKWPWIDERHEDSLAITTGIKNVITPIAICAPRPVNEEKANASFIADSPKRIAFLVEYYEAAEMEFRYVGRSGDTEFYRRLQAARAKLEAEDG